MASQSETAPIRTVWSPDMQTVVKGPLSDALHAKTWGKLMVSNGAHADAVTLTADQLSDFIDFHVIDRVGGATRHRYEAGAARWAAAERRAAA